MTKLELSQGHVAPDSPISVQLIKDHHPEARPWSAPHAAFSALTTPPRSLLAGTWRRPTRVAAWWRERARHRQVSRGPMSGPRTGGSSL
jgi:hypothetical protein